ncbi:DUF167 domain-containing protein [Pseudonocardia xinjiangensis]|uniref:DUF167 domain-containing protein n=1 Tax=Pseudonocardia xinjiangensis TaxID=75289 RepID=UPI0028AC75C6|nr:DUF167 domain-containing protein [Pseudonocardia xinjiangensis]
MRISVRVRPGSRADSVGGSRPGPHGPVLLVSVRARPVDGAANAAVREVLAEAFGLRPGKVEIVSGLWARDKVVALEGDETVLATRYAELLG